MTSLEQDAFDNVNCTFTFSSCFLGVLPCKNASSLESYIIFSPTVFYFSPTVFDSMMAKVPSYFHEKVQDKVTGIASKYMHKKGGYEIAAHKGRKVTETKEEAKPAEKEDDDSESEDTPSAFVMPANYATLDELRNRLKAKIQEQKQNGISNEEKRTKREKEAAEEKDKKKQKKQQQKKRKAEAKKEKSEAEKEQKEKKAKTEEASGDAERVVKLGKDKAVTLAKGQVLETEAGAVSTNPKNIVADFKFATVTQSAEAKEIAKAGMVSHKKGHKQQQLRELEKFQERVEKVKESGDATTAERMMQNQAVKSAVARASGEVVKDDMKLLKKSLKRKEKSKEKSKKKWEQKIAMQDKTNKDKRAAKDVRIKKKIEEKVAKRMGTFVKQKPSNKSNKKSKK